MLASPSDAIELLGGARAVADRVSKPYTTVASWASRESIPTTQWPHLIDFAAEKGLKNFTYEALAKAHAHRGQAA